MRPLVGWYVHHAGAGHVTRFLAVRPHLDADVVVFSSLPEPAGLPAATTWVPLDRDDDPIRRPDGSVRSPADAVPTARGLLHWAPLGHPGHARRMAEIAAAIGASPFRAFVVDVSVEVALLVRLLGVPPVLLAQPGDRSDEPHRLGYAAAERIIAPWPAGLHAAPALAAVAARVVEVGGISRFDGRVGGGEVEPGRVLFLAGGGAGAREETLGRIEAAARATPDARWTALGLGGGHDRASSAVLAGWVDDPWDHLRRAEVVVAAAGQNSVADLAAVGARAVVLPGERPFGEQAATGAALAAQGLAVVAESWPAPTAWPALLERARGLRPDWARWGVDGAAARAAAVIAEVAA